MVHTAQSKSGITERLVAAVKFNQNHFIARAMTDPVEPTTLVEIAAHFALLRTPSMASSSNSFYAAAKMVTSLTAMAASVPP